MPPAAPEARPLLVGFSLGSLLALWVGTQVVAWRLGHAPRRGWRWCALPSLFMIPVIAPEQTAALPSAAGAPYDGRYVAPPLWSRPHLPPIPRTVPGDVIRQSRQQFGVTRAQLAAGLGLGKNRLYKCEREGSPETPEWVLFTLTRWTAVERRSDAATLGSMAQPATVPRPRVAKRAPRPAAGTRGAPQDAGSIRSPRHGRPTGNGTGARADGGWDGRG